ncbi:hypothetical protein LCGC14_1126840 [marine sediment metagenome]|uniref:Uncharacterized protein n=1 Tax=marine sediment metagenome TaxID=412755 RepID=A0A0F9PKE6_9ZZZZ
MNIKYKKRLFKTRLIRRKGKGKLKSIGFGERTTQSIIVIYVEED